MYGLLKSVLVAFLAVLGSGHLYAEPKSNEGVTIQGRVILDLNRNGKLDDGETGLPNILVTDGIQFVRTGPDGFYRITIADDPLIPHKGAQVVAVSWPTGYWPVGREWFARISDVKPGQDVDFYLRTDKQRLPFTLVHGTDPHNNLTGSDFFRDEIDRMGDRVNLCVFTGDLGYMARENADRDFSSIRAFTRSFPIPMMHTPGNHDVCDIHTAKWTEDHPLAGYGGYTKYLGPVRWSFDYAGVHLVGLDWSRIKEDGTLQTGVSDTTIDWVEKDLKNVKPGTRVFVFMHHHHRHDDDKFWDVLVKHNVELLLAGHSHRNMVQSRRGIKAMTTMNLRGPYRLLTVEETGHALVDRCFGCKDPVSGYHSKHCQLFRPSLGNRHGEHAKIAEREIDAPTPVDGFRAKSLEVAAEIDPGTAKRVGVRLGSADPKGPSFEVAFADNEVSAGSLRSAAVKTRDQKTYNLHLIVDEGVARIYANGRILLERKFQPPEACGVTLFAEGGRASFRNVDIWELKNAD